MKYFSSILLLFFLWTYSYKAKAQDVFNLNAVVLSAKDSTPIGFVHIINTTTKYGVVADYNGEFNFNVMENDTLKLSAIGYETAKIAVKKNLSAIFVHPKNYDLEEFTLIPYKNFEEFKQAFADLELPDTTLHINPSIFMFDEDLYFYRGSGGFGIVIEGGISKLYDYFSKQGRSKRRYEELLARDRYKSYLAEKFNNETIRKATYITDDVTLNDLKEYCDFSDEFIANSNDYEIIKQIQDCYKEYLKANPAKKD